MNKEDLEIGQKVYVSYQDLFELKQGDIVESSIIKISNTDRVYYDFKIASNSNNNTSFRLSSIEGYGDVGKSMYGIRKIVFFNKEDAIKYHNQKIQKKIDELDQYFID